MGLWRFNNLIVTNLYNGDMEGSIHFNSLVSHSSSGDRKPPPPLIQAGGGNESISSVPPTSNSHQVSPINQRKTKGGAKRTKYRTDEERHSKEKERRNANNQRER